MRRCLSVLAVCVVVASLSVSAVRADYGLVAGTQAVNVAGQPVLVRATPGWDAAVSYELIAGAGVTVWDVAQPAADGSLWYAIDGGFVPAESLAAVTVPMAAEQPVQDASAAQTVDPMATDVTTTEWVEAAPVDTSGEVAPAETWVDPSLTTDGTSPDPALSAWISTTGTGGVATDPGASVPTDVAAEGTDPSLTAAATDPANSEWIDPATGAAPADTVSAEWIDPAVGEPVDGSSGEWIEPAPLPAADPAQIGTTTPVEVAQDVVAVDEVAPDASIVELEQQNRNNGNNNNNINDNDKDKDKDKDRGKNNDNDRDKNRGGDENGGGGGASTGSEIADFALQYEGYPYVYAGEGPNAFDCSGFTMFVIKKTLGIDITHDMFIQYEMGQQVGQGELQPGDLVFFKNTFRRGLSHNGIYIGNGEFIHAENESTGVVISDLNSDYYGSRWYGAVRLG